MARIIDHTNPQYMALRNISGNNRYNGAYYYSKEIVDNFIPNVATNRPWVTIHVKNQCMDRAIVFIHNNKRPEKYEWLKAYEDLVLVCGIQETMEKVRHLGTPLYLPLSVDVASVAQYRTEKTRETAFVGRPSKKKGIDLPKGIDYLEGIPRKELLAEMAKYRHVYAVGRTAIEAKVLGCEVLPYDPRFPNPDRWRILDNREAVKILQAKLNLLDR